MSKNTATGGDVVTVGRTTIVWDAIQAAATHEDKIRASRDALALVTLPDLSKPIPKFMVDLPWAEDREAAQDEILARIIAAESLEHATNDDALVKLEDVVGYSITIHGAVCRPGTIDEGWGAYLSMDVTVGNDPEHKVINTSSKEVAVITWRAYCEGRLPLRAHVILKGNPTPGRNQPVGLVVEEAL